MGHLVVDGRGAADHVLRGVESKRKSEDVPEVFGPSRRDGFQDETWILEEDGRI